MTYEKLVVLAEKAGALVFEQSLPTSTLKGLNFQNFIVVDNELQTEAEKLCILAEEFAHFQMETGDILDQKNLGSAKKEKLARALAYEKLVPVDSIIEAFELHLQSREEFADHLGVTEEFLEEAIRHYIDRHGPFKVHGECVVYFEPLGVMKRV
jgi:Zn-dependent peptidase ImmA (M78 family)